MAAPATPTDIVPRLRSGEACVNDPCRVMEAASGCLCAAAADEIERLRVIIRVKSLRWIPGITHGDIDALIEGDRP